MRKDISWPFQKEKHTQNCIVLQNNSEYPWVMQFFGGTLTKQQIPRIARMLPNTFFPYM